LEVSGVIPWALVAQAGDVEVGCRTRLAASLEELTGIHRHWAFLSTCHRVEVYGFGQGPERPEMWLLEGEDSVRHLFRVAAGLESAVVGETEILGQVRDALAAARAQGTDERVARLFETAIAVGRAARAQPIAVQGGLAERAVTWLGARAGLAGQPVLVVGTGVMGSALATAAAAAGGVVTMAGRRPERAKLDLAGAARCAPDVAAIGVALRGEWVELASVVKDGAARRLPPLADLSAPPAWVERAEAAVNTGVDEYMGWLLGRGSVETLVALRERGEARRQARVARLLRRLPDLNERERELVETMSRQLVTDLLHEPMRTLRADPDGSYGEAARRLFEL
jgi:glutamyl-tRNA reductase